MGIYVALKNETGQELASVADANSLLHRLLPEPYTDSISALGGIDWYGNTVFNRGQMKRFIDEWDVLAAGTSDPEQKSLLASVRTLAIRCQRDFHLYLWFIGD
jgi:hypothetical protein